MSDRETSRYGIVQQASIESADSRLCYLTSSEVSGLTLSFKENVYCTKRSFRTNCFHSIGNYVELILMKFVIINSALNARKQTLNLCKF